MREFEEYKQKIQENEEKIFQYQKNEQDLEDFSSQFDNTTRQLEQNLEEACYNMGDRSFHSIAQSVLEKQASQKYSFNQCNDEGRKYLSQARCQLENEANDLEWERRGLEDR